MASARKVEKIEKIEKVIIEDVAKFDYIELRLNLREAQILLALVGECHSGRMNSEINSIYYSLSNVPIITEGKIGGPMRCLIETEPRIKN